MENLDFYIAVALTVILLTMGFSVGGITERRHFRRLDNRERANGNFLITQIKSFPLAVSGQSPPALIVGEAVIATDYFKSFMAKLRKLFGGELRSYRSMQIRARREALQRVVEMARKQGYNAICNVRFVTADVGGNTSAKRVAMVAIMASATAYHSNVSAE